MKILKANAGALTNFEVLDFLRGRGAARDPTRVIVSIAPSEFKVYDYLEQSAASKQSRESIKEFVGKSVKYNLAKAEILNIINVRPSSAVEIYPIMEDFEKRMGDREDDLQELVELVAEAFPQPQNEESHEAPGNDGEIPGRESM